MSAAFESLSFDDFHKSVLPRQLAQRDDRLPSDYARTLRPLGIRIRETGESITYACDGQTLGASAGDERATTLVELAHESWEQIVHDLESAPGLIYGQRVKCLRGDLMQLVQWEPALRWLFQGRPVYDADKIDAAPTYKRTYGHHPLLAMICDGDEVLAVDVFHGEPELTLVLARLERAHHVAMV